MHNILVTGGAGFIGSNFIRYLQSIESDLFIINLDAITYAANLENLRDLPLPTRYCFIEGDICDRNLVDRIMRENRIDTIVHFAAETHVDRSIHNPGKFVQTNVVGTLTLLEACRQAWIIDEIVPFGAVRFHHVSTDEVYGSVGSNGAAFGETMPYLPSSPYAASKASSDHLVRAYFHTYKLPISITNCSNNYGPRQFPEKLIPLTILNALSGQPLPIYGDGQQVRDWLYVEDHCEAIYQVIRRGQAGVTYNVGGNNQPPNIQVIKEICAILDELVPNTVLIPHEKLCRFVADRPGHDRRYALDIEKIRRDLGWQPKEDLHSGLFKTVQWYVNNPEWVKTISGRTEYQTWMQINYGGRGKK